MLYKGREINCTLEQLNEFLNEIPVIKQVRNFTEPYNGTRIVNNTGNSRAVYYVLQGGDGVYL